MPVISLKKQQNKTRSIFSGKSKYDAFVQTPLSFERDQSRLPCTHVEVSKPYCVLLKFITG